MDAENMIPETFRLPEDIKAARALGEDRTRLHQGRALINLALLRSVNLRLLTTDQSDDWLPAKTERLAAHPTSALALLRKRL